MSGTGRTRTLNGICFNCDLTLPGRTPITTVQIAQCLELEKRIERLEQAANAGHHIRIVHVPYVADETGQAEAKRQALERNRAEGNQAAPVPDRLFQRVALIDLNCGPLPPYTDPVDDGFHVEREPTSLTA
jgi:hypothetical protein